MPNWERIRSRQEALNQIINGSKYGRQKGTLKTTFEAFLSSYCPPQDLQSCKPEHVRDFLTWKEEAGHTPLHTPICPYRGRPGSQPCPCPRTTSAGTVDSVLGQIRAILRDSGHGTEWYSVFNKGNPAASPLLKLHLKAVRKERATALAHPKQAIPLFLDKVARIQRHLTYKLLSSKMPTSRRYLLLRDRAYLKLIVFTGDRASDLGLIQTEQMTITDETVTIKALVGKSFSETAPRPLVFNKSENPELCLVQEFHAYLAGTQECKIHLPGGYLFRTLEKGGAKVSPNPVTSSAMTSRLKKYLQTLGVWEGETSHSARVGCSIMLTLLGTTPNDIKAHIGWTSDEMVERYTRKASAYREDGASHTLTTTAATPHSIQTMTRFRKRMSAAEPHTDTTMPWE